MRADYVEEINKYVIIDDNENSHEISEEVFDLFKQLESDRDHCARQWGRSRFKLFIAALFILYFCGNYFATHYI